MKLFAVAIENSQKPYERIKAFISSDHSFVIKNDIILRAEPTGNKKVSDL